MILTNNFKQIADEWKKKPQKFEAALANGLREGLRKYESHIVKEQLSGRKSPDYGLKRQSGTAANSTDVTMSYDGEDVVGRLTIGKNAWYLKLHEHYQFDGYATVKKGTCFVVPVHPQAQGHRPSDFNLSFIKIPGKNPILIRKMAKGGPKKVGVSYAGQKIYREDIMYVLTKKIYIPKRTYFYEEFKTVADTLIRDCIMRNLQKEVNAQ